MSCMPRLAVVAALATAGVAPLTLLSSCGGDDGGGGLPDAGYNCAVDDRGEDFTAGMEKTGALGITFTLVSADPAPPSRGDNHWVLQVSDANGPLDGATVDVKPFMPDHNHGTSIDTIVEPVAGQPGTFDLTKVNMFMPGVWETTIRATPAGGSQAQRDSVVFTFCIPG